MARRSIALLAPAFERAGGSFHLVGHSYGGAIALKAALRFPTKLKSLVLYEPVLFSVLLTDAPQSVAAREIMAVRDDTAHLAPEGVAERFIDYWMGAGTWAAMPESRRATLAGAVRAMKPEWHSAFNEPTPLDLAHAGGADTAPHRNRVDRRGARRGAAPRRRAAARAGRRDRGTGPHGPVTDPERVNSLIERFLSQV